MLRYKLTLSYDGTSYFGWQKTKMGPSIQEALQQAIAQITQERVIPEAASRTDRGVHAEGQIVSFVLHKEHPRLQIALNAVLPPDIRVLEASVVPDTFHPTLDAREKEYHYRISPDPAPHSRLYTWHYPFALDFNAMQRAATSLLGTHDFSAFTSRREKNPICTLSSIVIAPDCIALCGNRFLYKMARTLAGTLLYIGSGKLPPETAASILASRDRKQAGVTAPAHGLFLYQVRYDILAP